jgi:hypothetical protein
MYFYFDIFIYSVINFKKSKNLILFIIFNVLLNRKNRLRFKILNLKKKILCNSNA